jgi:hypothetical protein
MLMEYQVTENALSAFIAYASRELDIDETERKVSAMCGDAIPTALLNVARAANLASLHLRAGTSLS